jgi:hypothetical protein
VEAANACFIPVMAAAIGRHWSISFPERISIVEALTLE